MWRLELRPTLRPDCRLEANHKIFFFCCLSSPRWGRDIQGERGRASGRAGMARDDGVGLRAATDVCSRDGCVLGERSATGRRHLEERHKPIQEMQRHAFCLNQRPPADATCWGEKEGKEEERRAEEITKS